MSSSPSSASARAETLPECEPPRTTLGAPISTPRPASFEALRSRRRGRELGNADALLDGLLDMRGGGVVMAGQHDAARLAGGGDRGAVARRIALGFADAPLAEQLELVIRQLQLTLIVVGVGGRD